jgi:hypothetical protein
MAIDANSKSPIGVRSRQLRIRRCHDVDAATISLRL